MRSWLHGVSTLVAAALLLGCAGLATGPEKETGRLDRILKSRELRVGLSGAQPPLNMRNKAGELIGLEVDLVRALADSMDLTPRFVSRPFAELLPALEAGEVDLVISGMTITPERNARVAFAGPYLISGKSLLTKSAELADVSNLQSLDDAKLRFAALASSTSADFVRKRLPKAGLVTTSDYDAGVAMVLSDQVDALVADFPVCAVALLQHPDAGLSMLTTPFTMEPLGIALPADDPLLVNLVQNYLNSLDESGILSGLKAKWFSTGSWLDELP